MNAAPKTIAGFADVVKNAWRKNLLLVALLELTYDCNLDCRFCYNDRARRGTPLALHDYLRVLDELKALGALNVVLSGGEPMVHPAFFEIGAAARARGFVVRVKTNGLTLRGETLARLVRDVDPFVVEVSLHGASAATHDALTQVPGSFERLRDNLHAAKEAGVRMRINSTLTHLNEGELEGMYAIADALGFPLTIDAEVTPRDDGDQSPLALAASDAGMRALFRIQAARVSTLTSRAAGPAAPSTGASTAPMQKNESCGDDEEKHCGAGSSSLCIDPYGAVYPCVQWRREIGNVHTASLLDLWRSSPRLTEVRGLTMEIKQQLAAAGERAPFFNFCPGTAESVSNDPRLPTAANQRRADAALVVQGKLRVLP